MKFTYYFLSDFLNSKEIKKINSLCDKGGTLFYNQAPTIKTSVAKTILYAEINKIKNIKSTVNWINRECFGFDIYQNIDNDHFIQNTYSYNNKGQYKWHFDGEPYTRNYTIKLTTLINLSETKYEGGNFYLFDGKPLHVKELDTPGSLIVFPSYFLHKVTPVRTGVRKSGTLFSTGPWWR